jgi:glycosyltransferase involved in cell wall biosynthesis
MTTLSVVIPAYNEENGIADIVSRVLAIRPELPKIGVDELELLVVDDGSKDGTVTIVQTMARDCTALKLICHPKNKGYGAALKTGFANARGELIGFLDADGTYPPEYFPELCKGVLGGSDIVVGSRMSGSDSKMPFTRRVGNFFFANLLTILSNQRVSDSASGMRVFKREVLQQIYPLPDGLNLTPVMSTRALHEGIRITELAIPYSERKGRSKLSVVRDGLTFLRSMLWTVLAYNPVRILGMAGLVGLLVTLAIGAGVVIARLNGVTSLSLWGVAAVYTALVAGVTGISVFALGATFNYLVSLFYQRPIRQGLFGKPLFKTSLESHFGWIGLLGALAGTAVAITSVAIGSANGWEITRIWLWLLGSAMLFLVGVQLIIYWVLMRVLQELSQSAVKAEKDRLAI